MHGQKAWCRYAVLMVALFGCSQAMSSVVITGTRVVYPADKKEVTVKINNEGSNPVLVQSWVDQGDPASTPSNSSAPFVISPPVSRVDPGKGQSLRLMFTGAPLSGDKESVFWLNVLEIPAKVTTHEDQNVLQMAFRSRIKVFIVPPSCRVRLQPLWMPCSLKLSRSRAELTPCKHLTPLRFMYHKVI